MAKTRRVDVHSHVFPREMFDLIRARPHDYGMHFANTPAGEKLLREDGQHGGETFRPLARYGDAADAEHGRRGC